MNPQIAYVQELLKQGNRLDGRKLDEYRDIEIETNVVSTAEGSARVKIGSTEVIAGVKLSIGKPFPDTPDEGALMVSAELLPLSNPNFESGPPSIDSIELSRVVDRGIREAKAVDPKTLCIEAGESVWIISIDICPINADGNLFDAAGIAALAALQDTVYPHYDGEKLDYKKKTDEKLDLKKLPLPITVYKIGETLFLDPLPQEEEIADARLTIATTVEGFCGMQKGGEKPLTIDEVDKMVDLAMKKSKEIRKKLKN